MTPRNMTVETETILIKLLEELKADVKELRQDVNQINVNQARLKGKVDTLAVEVSTIKEELKEIKSDLKGRISIQTYWFLVLISLLIAIVGKESFLP